MKYCKIVIKNIVQYQCYFFLFSISISEMAQRALFFVSLGTTRS